MTAEADVEGPLPGAVACVCLACVGTYLLCLDMMWVEWWDNEAAYTTLEEASRTRFSVASLAGLRVTYRAIWAINAACDVVLIGAALAVARSAWTATRTDDAKFVSTMRFYWWTAVAAWSVGFIAEAATKWYFSVVDAVTVTS